MGVGIMGEEESRFRAEAVAEAEPDWDLWAPDRPYDLRTGNEDVQERARSRRSQRSRG